MHESITHYCAMKSLTKLQLIGFILFTVIRTVPEN